MKLHDDKKILTSQLSCEVTSINIGPRVEIEIFGQRKLTAYEKHPVTHDVILDKKGIVGDGHYAREAEEAFDHAVQLYSQENYQFWTERLKKPLRMGIFGESITFLGPNEFFLRIGDRIHVDDVVLEIAGPRIPCAKLAHFIGETLAFPRLFQESFRTGIYARVLSPGRLRSSSKLTVETVDSSLPLVCEITAALLERNPDEDWMRSMIGETRLSAAIKALFSRKLRALSSRTIGQPPVRD